MQSQQKTEYLTSSIYYQVLSGLLESRDIDGAIKFQNTHGILYTDPIPAEDRSTLESTQWPEYTEEMQSLWTTYLQVHGSCIDR